MANDQPTQYELSRQFFDWAFENPDLVKPVHIAVYFFAMEHCNRLGWKEKFGLPTTMSMEAIGIKSYKTYKVTFDELVQWGFIKVIKKASNQYSAVIIAMVKNTKAHTKAYTKATLKHAPKQVQSIDQSTCESTDSIDKPNNQEPNNHKPITENQKKFIPPNKKEVIEYFIEKGFDEKLAAKAFDYYNEADWKDSKGNKVLNWKQKMLANWMKDENKPSNIKSIHNGKELKPTSSPVSGARFGQL
jgi:hypothetical protein